MTPRAIQQSLQKDWIKWSPSLEAGVKVIDNQHKVLVNLVNNLYKHEAGSEAEERAYFKKVIHLAVNYVRIHFRTEEKIMIRTKCPNYEEHKKEHDSFILMIIEQVRDVEAGKRVTLAEFTKFLKEWILSHIAIMDKQYFSYFKEIATRKADGKLSITLADVK